MRKGILVSFLFIALGLGMSSCKKCYVCTITTTVQYYNTDSTEVLTTELCSGKNGAGPDLNVSVQDIEANGYICTQK